MRSDTGLYVLATAVLLLGLGNQLQNGPAYHAASAWTGALAHRLAVKIDATPVLARSDEASRRIQLADFAVQQRTACVNARIAREQARMARVRAQLAREWTTKSVHLDRLCIEQ